VDNISGRFVSNLFSPCKNQVAKKCYKINISVIYVLFQADGTALMKEAVKTDGCD